MKKMGSKILSGRGLKRKRGSVSSVVKKAKNRKKPTTNKKQGRGRRFVKLFHKIPDFFKGMLL